MREHGNSETSDQDFIWFMNNSKVHRCHKSSKYSAKGWELELNKARSKQSDGSTKKLPWKTKGHFKMMATKRHNTGFSQLQLWGGAGELEKTSWPQTDEKLKLKAFLQSHIDFSNLICKYFPPKPKKEVNTCRYIIIFHHAILIISPKFCHVSSLRSRFLPELFPSKSPKWLVRPTSKLSPQRPGVFRKQPMPTKRTTG